MKCFWMTGRPQTRQQPLRQLHLRPVRTSPVKALNLQSFYPSSWQRAKATKRLQIAGGIVFAGALLTQIPTAPTAFWPAASEPASFQSSLWASTGLVRQSVVDLYRVQRLFMEVALESGDASEAPVNTTAAAPGTANSMASAAPMTAAQAASTVASVTANPAARTVPQPPTLPRSAVNVAFDPAKTIDTNLEMRVAVARNVGSLEVATSTAGSLMDLNGQGFCNLSAQRSVVVRPQGGGLGYSGCQLTHAVWLEPGNGGYVYVGNAWFKGRVLLMGNGSTLIAVNFVLMHDYLSSVVGSEMYVNWPLEALKAQAIAARSYALVHHVRHANRPYDLDNTQRYQAYLGIAKETNTTPAAVAATSGEFISYNGGIVESLYAASDAIVQAAHGGRGMSQTGAMELAQQGFRYTEILGNYYPNTSLSRLVVQ
jgi:stage II sporulation protein D